ncbi:hypothetical protein BN946_scf184473.g8 [Trametes cinnabarina]|uniref:F-box domain-containing protein n=1 Tax=Pycnoporus cinnabarinus TaxID=5643 RepID=A0A060SXS9_PYCCI|nr:hypothetical protein BN946_scf184473.g8 [Trametes cinnabarina]
MPSLLPQQVVDRIIDAIEDRGTLRSCTLVGRQWLAASRFNLLYDVYISSRSSFETFVQVRDAPHIASAYVNVHSLRLVEDEQRPWLHLFPLTFSPILFPHAFFLAFSRFTWDEHPPTPHFYDACTQFTSVTTLDISQGLFEDFTDFCRLILAFKNLRRVFVENVGWHASPRGSDWANQSTELRLQLFWMTPVSVDAVGPASDWLLSSGSVETLTDLQIGGSRLEHFQVSVKAWSSDVSLDLSFNTSLRSLHVRDIDAFTREYLPPFMKRLSARNLSDLTFHLSIHGLGQMNCLRALCTHIVAILSRDDFPALQVLTVWIREAPPVEEISLADLVREVRSWMTIMDGRVFLRVSPWYTLVK